jgi:hypothetical protein
MHGGLPHNLEFIETFQSTQVLEPWQQRGTSRLSGQPDFSIGPMPSGSYTDWKARANFTATPSIVEIVVDMDLGDDPNKTYEIYWINYAFDLYIYPSFLAVPHEYQWILKGSAGQALYTSPPCEYIPSNNITGCNETVPTGISGVRTVTFIHRTKQPVQMSTTGYEYVVSIDNLSVETTEIVYPPTATPTPSPTATPDPCMFRPNDTAELVNAITMGNLNSPLQTRICLTPNGLYALNDTHAQNGSGLPPITGNIVIEGNGATITRDTSASAFRILTVESAGVVLLDNVRLTHGSADTGSGGAIYNAGNLTLEDSFVMDSTALDYGGGIYNHLSGTLTLRRSQVSNNAVTLYSGGGIYNYLGLVTIEDSGLLYNQAGDEDGWGWGGGLDTYFGAVNIARSRIIGNIAGFAGGVDNYLGTLTISRSILEGNIAQTSAGGAVAADGNTTISESCIANNIAPNNIAVHNIGTTVITAAGNWWGDSSGPAHASNPGGAGQGISDNVSYDNFLLNSNCDSVIFTPTPTPTAAICQPSGSVQAAQDPTCPGEETPTPIFCISRPVVDYVPGLNIRAQPNWEASRVAVLGGTLRITGYYVALGDRWLRVDPYDNPGQPHDGSKGWVWEDVFRDPCADGKSVDDLPVLDGEGNIIANPPTPMPTATPLPPPPTPEFPGPSCTGIHTAKPTNMRFDPYADAQIVLVLDNWAEVDVYAKTDSGSAPIDSTSTVWYQVGYTRANGDLIFGWIHSSVLDATDIANLCTNVPEVFRPTPTPPPTAIPSLTPTPLPDYSDSFALPMAPLNPSTPPLLTDCLSPSYISAYLGSRDINPQSPPPPTPGQPIVSPTSAEVMIVDTTFEIDAGLENPNNAGLGNFVALRIKMQDVPEIIRNDISTYYGLRIPDTSTGYLYIGYAHLQNVIVNPGDQLTYGQIVGFSGNTGNAEIAHLDVTAFYIPQTGPRGTLPIPRSAYFDGSPYTPDNMRFWYNSYYILFIWPQDVFGVRVSIDPLVLWPSLNIGCPYPSNRD